MHQRGFEPRPSAWEADMLDHYTIGALSACLLASLAYAPSGARTLDHGYIRPVRYQLRQWSLSYT